MLRGSAKSSASPAGGLRQEMSARLGLNTGDRQCCYKILNPDLSEAAGDVTYDPAKSVTLVQAVDSDLGTAYQKGARKPYEHGVAVVAVESLEDVAAMIERVQHYPRIAIIRGEPRATVDWSTSQRRSNENFEDIAKYWAVFDIDNVAAPDGIDPNDPNWIRSVVEQHLPDAEGIDILINYSSSAGTPEQAAVKAHCFVWFDTPVLTSTLRGYIQAINDRSTGRQVFDPAAARLTQPIYTALPLSETETVFEVSGRPGRKRVVLSRGVRRTAGLDTSLFAVDSGSVRQGDGAPLEFVGKSVAEILDTIGDHAGGHGFYAPTVAAVFEMRRTDPDATVDNAIATLRERISAAVAAPGRENDRAARLQDLPRIVRSIFARKPPPRHVRPASKSRPQRKLAAPTYDFPGLSLRAATEANAEAITNWIASSLHLAGLKREAGDEGVGRKRVREIAKERISAVAEFYGRHGIAVPDGYAEGPALQITGTVGLGKTNAVLGALSRADDAGAVGLYLAPNHKKLDEFAADAGRAIHTVVYRGYDQRDPDAKGETVCRIPDDYRTALETGQEDKLCAICPERRHCHQKKQESWISQAFADRELGNASLIAAASERVFRGGRILFCGDIDFVVVDEAVDTEDNALKFDRSILIGDRIKGLIDQADIANLLEQGETAAEMRSRTIKTLDQLAQAFGGGHRNWLENIRKKVSIDAVRRAAYVLEEARVAQNKHARVNIADDADLETARQALADTRRKLDDSLDLTPVIELLFTVAREYHHAQRAQLNGVLPPERNSSDQRLHVAKRKTTHIPKDVPLLMLDANGRRDRNARTFKRLIADVPLRVEFDPSTRVLQLADQGNKTQRFGLTALTGKRADGVSSNRSDPARVRQNWLELLRVVQKLRQQADGATTEAALFGSKKVIKHFEALRAELGADAGGIRTGWYGAVRGSNAWEDCAVHVLLPHRVDPRAVPMKAAAWSEVHGAALDHDFNIYGDENKKTPGIGYIRTRDGSVVETTFLDYRDPRHIEAHRIVVDDEVNQAIGRSRAIRRERRVILILDTRPFDVTVDEVVTWEDLREFGSDAKSLVTRVLDEAFRSDGGLIVSRRQIQSRFGDLGVSNNTTAQLVYDALMELGAREIGPSSVRVDSMASGTNLRFLSFSVISTTKPSTYITKATQEWPSVIAKLAGQMPKRIELHYRGRQVDVTEYARTYMKAAMHVGQRSEPEARWDLNVQADRPDFARARLDGPDHSALPIATSQRECFNAWIAGDVFSKFDQVDAEIVQAWLREVFDLNRAARQDELAEQEGVEAVA